MKIKRRQPGSAGWLFKHIPSQLKRKLWMRTLSSKKKFLTEKSMNWTTMNNERLLLGNSSEATLSEEENDGRVMVAERHRPLMVDSRDSNPFFEGESSFLNETDSRVIVSTPMSGSASESNDSDVPLDDTLESTKLALYDTDDEVIEEEVGVDDDERVADRIFVVEDRDIAVAVLRHPVEVVFCGRAFLQSLFGAVSIFGYRLDENCVGPVKVFSSYNFSYLTLKTEESETNISRAAQSRYIKQQLSQIGATNVSGQVLSVLDVGSVVIILRRAPETGSVKYACYLTSKLFAPPASRFDRPDFKKFGFCLAVASSRKWILADDQEKLASYVVKNILHAQSCGSTAPRVVVCGGKNVGKSMFMKYLINKALNVCEKVIHLEGDPGQTEFTPVGCVALTKVQEPVIGPAFTHCRKPERMCYVGGVNVENSPDLYSSSIQQLVEYHRTHLANHPLFINTMGWNKGLGVSLLVDVLRAASPTIIVQFDCGPSQMSHNLPVLDADFLQSACGWNSSCEMLAPVQTELKILEPPDSQVKLASGVMPAARCRNLSIFAYMGQLQKPHLEFQPINSFTPYSVPWSAVAVHSCHQEMPASQVMHALNGNLVALCHVDESKLMDSVIPDYPKRITESPENVCYGLGLVRGIDFRNKLFLVITPEKLSSLRNVNAFLMGSGKIPDEFFITQEVEGRVPFVCQSKIGTTGLAHPSKDRVFRKRITSLSKTTTF